MTLREEIITIGLCALATIITRFLPFIVFSEKRPIPAYVKFLGNALPSAIFAMLVIYCLRNVNLMSGNHAIPEIISIVLIVLLHLWKRQMLLSIAAGTISYIVLLNLM